MRKFIAAMMVAGATIVGGQAIAADMPYYPPIIEIPDVDYGVSGSFYLRGSAALNLMWTPYVNHPDAQSADKTFAITEFGYGYSVGAGAGTAAVMAGGRNPATLSSGAPVTIRLEGPATVTIQK